MSYRSQVNTQNINELSFKASKAMSDASNGLISVGQLLNPVTAANILKNISVDCEVGSEVWNMMYEEMVWRSCEGLSLSIVTRLQIESHQVLKCVA